MTIEQLLRDQLELATRDVPRGPDLARSIRDGRRRRRTARVGASCAAVVVLTAGVVGLRAASGDQGSTVAQDPPVTHRGAAAPPPPRDFVPGSDFDETMAAVVAEHLPSLPAPDDVYPSDGDTAGPLPDNAAARAEDWQASYTTPGGQVRVITGLPVEMDGWRCSDCDARQVTGGTLYHQTYSTEGGRIWWFGTYFVSDDGRFVNAFEAVDAPDQQTAVEGRSLADADLEALVEDPRLGF